MGLNDFAGFWKRKNVAQQQFQSLRKVHSGSLQGKWTSSRVISSISNNAICDSIQCYSITIYSIQFYSITIYSIQFYAITIYSIQFYSITIYSIQFYSITIDIIDSI